MQSNTKPKRRVNAPKVAEVTKALVPEDQPQRFKLAEAGFLGVNLWNGVSNDEIKRELNFPYSLKTFKQMSYHSAINAALTLYEVMALKANWKVTAPANATPEEIKRTEFIKECMQDMEHSWEDFIRDVLSMNVYGFAIHEKVYRKRYTSNGSMYNDGLIGWQKLPIRSQESISRFVPSEDGNDIVGVQQSMYGVTDSRYFDSKQVFPQPLPMKKVMHFKVGRHRGDPYGKSPLRDAYLAWRYLTVLEDIEATGVAKDLQGIPVLTLPPQMMAADAPADQKAAYAYFQNCMVNLQNNQQASIILPALFDSETKQPLIKLELLRNEGKKNFDTVQVKEYYKNLILTSLFADVLIMGQGKTGSFALGSIKTTLIGNVIESMLKTIRDVVNRDLIRQTYQLNGWDTARACTVDYDNLEPIDLESLSKYVQRISSVGMMVKDVETINRIRSIMGVDPVEMTEEELVDKLTPETSRAGDGMAKGSGNGTSDEVAGTDNSSMNLSNNA